MANMCFVGCTAVKKWYRRKKSKDNINKNKSMDDGVGQQLFKEQCEGRCRVEMLRKLCTKATTQRWKIPPSGVTASQFIPNDFGISIVSTYICDKRYLPR